MKQNKSVFKKLVSYNTPVVNIFLGLIVSIVQGGLMPLIGALMAKMLFVLMEVVDMNKMRTEADKWCLLMLILSLIALVTGFCQKFSFGVIGENVTFNVRRKLYRKIIEKE